MPCLEKSQVLLLFTTMGGRQSVYLVHDATNLSGTQCIMFSTMISQITKNSGKQKKKIQIYSNPLLPDWRICSQENYVLWPSSLVLAQANLLKDISMILQNPPSKQQLQNTLTLYSYTLSNKMFQNTKFWITRKIG